MNSERAASLAVATGETEGFVKVIAHPVTGELLGAHVVGHNASELIHELVLARHGELLVDDLAGMIHAHPTLAEAVGEAARGVTGEPIHL